MQYVRKPMIPGMVLALAAILLSPGCSPNLAIEVGPFPVTVAAGEGSFGPADFVTKIPSGLTVTRTRDFCEIPSEDEAAAGVRMVGNINVSRFVQLSRIELFQIVIAATEGDFGFANEVVLRYIPAHSSGPAPDPVVLGVASNPSGFGSTIVLTPPEGVDFLALIRENDASGVDACPTLEIEITAHSLPLQTVRYAAEAHLDAYAMAGIHP